MSTILGAVTDRVLSGSYHQGHECFLPHSGKQCVANVLSFFCLSHHRQLANFTRVSLDQILATGYVLYGLIRDHVAEDYLHTEDLPQNFVLNGSNYTLYIRHSSNGLIDGSDSVAQVLRWAFGLSTDVFFFCQDKCIGLKYYHGSYYLFDSHSNSPIGKPAPDGTSCLIKFKNFSFMCQHIELLYLEKGCLVFEAVPCAVRFGTECVSFKYEVQPESIPSVISRKGKLGEANKFHRCHTDCITRTRPHVIVGTFHQGDKRFLPHSGKQCVANVLSFFCNSIKESVDMMTQFCLDTILVRGNRLYDLIHKHVHQNYLDTEDLPRNFVLGRERYLLEINQSSNGCMGQTNSVTDVMSWAFTHCKNVFFLCQGKCIGLKYHAGLYYLFDSHSNSPHGFPAAKGTSCVVKFCSIDQMCEHIKQLYHNSGKMFFEAVPCKLESPGMPKEVYFEIDAESIPSLCSRTKSKRKVKGTECKKKVSILPFYRVVNRSDIDSAGIHKIEKGTRRKNYPLNDGVEVEAHSIPSGCARSKSKQKVKGTYCPVRVSVPYCHIVTRDDALAVIHQNFKRKRRKRHLLVRGDVSNANFTIGTIDGVTSTSDDQAYVPESTSEIPNPLSHYSKVVPGGSANDFVCISDDEAGVKKSTSDVPGPLSHNMVSSIDRDGSTADGAKYAADNQANMEISISNLPKTLNCSIEESGDKVCQSNTTSDVQKSTCGIHYSLSKTRDGDICTADCEAVVEKSCSGIPNPVSHGIKENAKGAFGIKSKDLLDESNNSPNVDITEVYDCLNTMMKETGRIPFFDLASVEGQRPLDIVFDEVPEKMGIPCIYFGKSINKSFPSNISFNECCKLEVPSGNHRVKKRALTFYKYKQYEPLFIHKNASFSLRYVKGGRDDTVSDIQSAAVRGANDSENSFFVLRELCNSSQDRQETKDQLLAIVAQTGIPTFFISLSSDFYWNDLLRNLGKIVDDETYSDDQLHNMPCVEKCRLMNADPAACWRFLDMHFNELLTKVLYDKSCPLGPVVDHLYRIEFPYRSHPNVHMLIYCKDHTKYFARQVTKNMCDYVDKYIRFSLERPEYALEMSRLRSRKQIPNPGCRSLHNQNEHQCPRPVQRHIEAVKKCVKYENSSSLSSKHLKKESLLEEYLSAHVVGDEDWPITINGLKLEHESLGNCERCITGFTSIESLYVHLHSHV